MQPSPETSRQPPRWIGSVILTMLFVLGGVSFYMGVVRAPVFDPNRPYTGDFNALFSTADTHLAAARRLIEDRRDALRNPGSFEPPPLDAALKHIDISLKHRPLDAYAWVLKAQQELAIGRQSTAPGRFDPAIRSLRRANELAPNSIGLTAPRLVLASRLWRNLDDSDKVEIRRQVRDSWFFQGARVPVVTVTSRNVRAGRIAREALAEDPLKLADYESLLHQIKLRRRRS